MPKGGQCKIGLCKSETDFRISLSLDYGPMENDTNGNDRRYLGRNGMVAIRETNLFILKMYVNFKTLVRIPQKDYNGELL